MNSLTTKGSGFRKNKRNIYLKKNKHHFHLQYGCKRIECVYCFHGFPYQMHINMVKARG